MTENCKCDYELNLLFFSGIDTDTQRAQLCYNLLQFSEAHRKRSNPIVSEVLEKQAETLWKCNLKGKKGYSWKAMKNHTWKGANVV